MLIELILLLVVLCTTVAGYRKGILGALCSLLIMVVAFFGAFIAMQTLSDRAAERLTPKLEVFVAQQTVGKLSEKTQDYMESAEEKTFSVGGTAYSVGDIVSLLKSLGFDVEESAQKAVESVSSDAVGIYAKTLAEELAEPVARAAVFATAFLIIYLVLHTLELLFASGEKMPAIKSLNHLGGALVGFFTAAVLLTILVTLLTAAGLLTEAETGGPVLRLLQRVTQLIL